MNNSFINNMNLLNEGKKDFYAKLTCDSVLIQGRHWDTPPFLTILLTTYKRPDLLKEALDSAVNQVGFNDYQIIVVDNEGLEAAGDTPTSQLMKEYVDDKVIYYRNEKEVVFKMDTAARLAKSQWICFLHDDDILVENHVATMVRILKKNSDIGYLTCPLMEFTEDIERDKLERLKKAKVHEVNIHCYPPQYIALGFWPGWIGALINREKYIRMGGVPTYGNSIADYVMIVKYMYRYRDLYHLESAIPLYLRRVSKRQLSAKGTEVWTDQLSKSYQFKQLQNMIYHPIMHGYFDRLSAYLTFESCINRSKEYDNTNIDVFEVMRRAGIPKRRYTWKWLQKLDQQIVKPYRWIITGKLFNGLFRCVKKEHIVFDDVE